MRELPYVHVSTEPVGPIPRRREAAAWLRERMHAMGMRSFDGTRISVAEMYARCKAINRSLADVLSEGRRRPWPEDAPSVDAVEAHLRRKMREARESLHWSHAETARRLRQMRGPLARGEASYHPDVVTVTRMARLYAEDPASWLEEAFVAMPVENAVPVGPGFAPVVRDYASDATSDPAEDAGTAAVDAGYRKRGKVFWWANARKPPVRPKGSYRKAASRRKNVTRDMIAKRG